MSVKCSAMNLLLLLGEEKFQTFRCSKTFATLFITLYHNGDNLSQVKARY